MHLITLLSVIALWLVLFITMFIGFMWRRIEEFADKFGASHRARFATSALFVVAAVLLILFAEGWC